MNQDQEEINKNDINKPVQLSVTSLNVPGDGHPGNKIQEIAKESHYGRGITASNVTEGAQVSARSLVGDESINSETVQISEKKTVEAPTKKREDLDLSNYIKKSVGTQEDKQTVPKTTPEISEDSLVEEEKLLAQKLAKFPDGELLISSNKEKGSDSTVEKNQKISKLEDDFMSTEKSGILTEKNMALEEAGVFNDAELSTQIRDIAKIQDEIAEIKALLIEKEAEIKEVGKKIHILGVDHDAATALEGELKEYETRLKEKSDKLQEKISKLQKIIQDNPRALVAIKNNTEAGGIPEIKALLDNIERRSATKIEPVSTAIISDKKKTDGMLSAEAIIRKETGGLVGAIRESMLKIDNTANEKQVEEIFEFFVRNILDELKEEGKSHKEALSEYKAMIKALEAGNGVIEVVLEESGKMIARIKDNASKVVTATDVADNYNYQVAA